jgi:hypothetical protein
MVRYHGIERRCALVRNVATPGHKLIKLEFGPCADELRPFLFGGDGFPAEIAQIDTRGARLYSRRDKSRTSHIVRDQKRGEMVRNVVLHD